MFSWFKKCFPSLKKVETQVVLDLPAWSVADANQLQGFLESRTGKKLLDRLRHTATAMCLDTQHCDEQMSADRRSFSLVINGIESLADEEYWRYRDREYLAREFLGEVVIEGDYDEDLAE